MHHQIRAFFPFLSATFTHIRIHGFALVSNFAMTNLSEHCYNNKYIIIYITNKNVSHIRKKGIQEKEDVPTYLRERQNNNNSVHDTRI